MKSVRSGIELYSTQEVRRRTGLFLHFCLNNGEAKPLSRFVAFHSGKATYLHAGN